MFRLRAASPAVIWLPGIERQHQPARHSKYLLSVSALSEPPIYTRFCLRPGQCLPTHIRVDHGSYKMGLTEKYLRLAWQIPLLLFL
jgi:hypothetical protein